MYGSTTLSISDVAFVNRTKTPLLICSKRSSWRILRGFGAILLILGIRGQHFVLLRKVDGATEEDVRVQEGGLSSPFDTDNENQLRLGRDVVGAFLLAQAG